jgi:hypothetical protein
MADVKWVKYKDMGGPRCLGSAKYNPAQPWNTWQQVMGVVARCEGNHDTVVMYDGTGVTWGFLQWTFTSGRLQDMLKFFQTQYRALIWDKHFVKDGQFILAPYGIPASEIDNPRMSKSQLVAACMGQNLSPTSGKAQAMKLANLFANLGCIPEIQAAQIEFAIKEFTDSLDATRPPLKGKVAPPTIDQLLKDTWNTPLPALFFNLWQNSPGGAYIMFSKAYLLWNRANPEVYFQDIWRRLNKTAYADWGWASRQYLESGKKNPPRIVRIQPAIKEFYGIDLPYFK